MQEVQPTVCQRNREHPPRQDERTPLWHKKKGNRKNSCSPLLPTGPHALWRTCKWGGLRRYTGTAHNGEERETASSSERCPHTGWTWTNDIMAYAITEYNITAYANTRHTPRTIDSSLPFLYFLTTTVSILHGLFCTVCPALYAWRRSYGTETLHIVVKLCALKDCFRYSFKNILV